MFLCRRRSSFMLHFSAVLITSRKPPTTQERNSLTEIPMFCLVVLFYSRRLRRAKYLKEQQHARCREKEMEKYTR